MGTEPPAHKECRKRLLALHPNTITASVAYGEGARIVAGGIGIIGGPDTISVDVKEGNTSEQDGVMVTEVSYVYATRNGGDGAASSTRYRKVTTLYRKDYVLTPEIAKVPNKSLNLTCDPIGVD